ncbi:MAG: phosphatase PAP2 family protein [Desulfovibrionaceae bacterium]|nr:phosphatase PAP2 family protein [Desulfovibrionaceae bacterium]
MKRLLLPLLAILLCAGPASARVTYGKDASTKPEAYFSVNDQGLDSAALLPPPPDYNSILFLHDRDMYAYGLSLRGTERAKQAAEDADTKQLPKVFSKAFGGEITQEAMPELFSLLRRAKSELGSMSTRTAKDTFKRVRPFVLFNDPTCYPPHEKKLRKQPSYPSGHSSQGWGIALLLAEINPGRKEIILRRGYEYGQSRVICGYHWQSDVDAGRLAAAGGLANLHANPAFLRHLERAKKEFAKLAAQGKVKTE